MPRVTRKELDAKLGVLNMIMKYDSKFNINAEGYRVTTADESRDLSPRLKPRDMALWLDGALFALTEMRS